ncbi:hypothetical protein RHODGE_RHODGE_04582 [Rhodoplanes serenus]|uniref:Outer membrane protein beta-barrel domain-containing protein n=1 Tax=Rhodoplanes serenus TaxID=200615 RepID=A0A3S4FCZ6_9BRAD|nr:outer membrane protein [Rhodoplanes serenus]MBI5111529.1 porin family protein [Rhodovulum sp.]VCU11371.1 hypothetical protein RHODGE_RHODGE_04582 [Rhodoplanes serenus]
MTFTRITTAGLIAATLLSAPSIAADMRYSAPYPQPAPPYAAVPTWTGPYLGINLGYQFGSSQFGLKPDGFVGGIQGGYNYQIGQFVIGGETDFQFSGAEDTFAPYKFSNPWFGTLRGRVGFAINNILLYGTGGFAYGRGEVEWFGWSQTKTHTGWTAGGGIEVAFTPNWSARAEYLYVDLDNEFYNGLGFNAGIESSILRFGLNYRF